MEENFKQIKHIENSKGKEYITVDKITYKDIL